MKSPFLLFLPAAVGAAGMYVAVQPGPAKRESLVADPIRSAEQPAEREADPGGDFTTHFWSNTKVGRKKNEVVPVAARKTRVEKPGFASQSAPASAPAPAPSTYEARPIARKELERRAKYVEEEANTELARLAPRLDLTEAQQDRIFGILVRGSRSFDPVMEIGNDVPGEENIADQLEEGASTEDQVHSELGIDQQLAYEEEVADRYAWWEDVMDHLLEDTEIPVPGEGIDEANDLPPMLADDLPEKDVTRGSSLPSS